MTVALRLTDRAIAFEPILPHRLTGNAGTPRRSSQMQHPRKCPSTFSRAAIPILLNRSRSPQTSTTWFTNSSSDSRDQAGDSRRSPNVAVRLRWSPRKPLAKRRIPESHFQTCRSLKETQINPCWRKRAPDLLREALPEILHASNSASARRLRYRHQQTEF